MSIGPTPPTGPHLSEDDVLILGERSVYKNPNRYLEPDERLAELRRIYDLIGAYPHGWREASILSGLLEFPSPEGASKYILAAKMYEERTEQRKLEKGTTLKSLVDINGKRPSETIMESLADESIGYLEDAQSQLKLLNLLKAEIGENRDEAEERFGDVDRLAKWRFDPTLRPAMFYLVRYKDSFMFERGQGKDRLDSDYETMTGDMLQSAAFITNDQTVITMRNIVDEAIRIEGFRAQAWSEQIFGREAEPEKGITKRSGMIDVLGLKDYLQRRFQQVSPDEPFLGAIWTGEYKAAEK